MTRKICTIFNTIQQDLLLVVIWDSEQNVNLDDSS